MKIDIPIEVSARHIHLCKEDLENLFGQGYALQIKQQLTQASDFAAQETVVLEWQGKKLENVRIVGPLREKTQVEISMTDAVFFGANPPLRLSGDIEGSAKINLHGPKGSTELGQGLIIAKRHIHCNLAEAKKLGLKPGKNVSVEIAGERPVVFENVAVRIKDDYNLCLHLDTDEANAAGIKKIGRGSIIKKGLFS